MGKIGDLFVRLGLKADDYNKGIDKAKTANKGFSQSLANLKMRALAIWAMIAKAVQAVAKEAVQASNAIGDTWAATMGGMRAAWRTWINNIWKDFEGKNFGQLFKDNLLRPITNYADAFQEGGKWYDVLTTFFTGFSGKNLRSRDYMAGVAKGAGEDLTRALDAEFELDHSIKLRKQGIQERLNELLIDMRDMTLSGAQRNAAVEEYKSLMQPIIDAQVQSYEGMFATAVETWQRGMQKTRQYTDEEVKEFFTYYGTATQEMAEKYPELRDIYENFKGDTENGVIFDLIAKMNEASNFMSNVDRQMARVTNKVKVEEAREQAAALKEIGKGVKEIEKIADEKIEFDIDLGLDEELEEMEAFWDKWQEEFDYNIDQILRKQQEEVQKVANMNQMLEDSFVSSYSNSIKALTDLMMGIEGADGKQVMAAFIAPFADTMVQMGELIMAEGIAMEAFKKSIKNPYVAIAAGAALIAIGSAVSSGLQRMVANPVGGTSASVGTSSTGETDTMVQDITIHVVGEISGDKILLAGQKTLNKWNR